MKRKYEDTSYILDNKEKELNQARRMVDYEESKNYEAKDKVRKLERENQTLGYLAESHKKEAMVNRRLREDEAERNIELSMGKRSLEKRAREKEFEAYSALQEKDRIAERQGELLEENYYKSQELDALKEHADVLDSQNYKVTQSNICQLTTEIENIANEDEVIRRDLDRRHRVDFLKSKNQNQIMKSAEKLSRSRSPVRSPYRSPNKYSSPYRSPTNKY